MNERKDELMTLDRIKIVGEEGRRTLLHLIDLCSLHISNSLTYLISKREGLQSACILLVYLLVLVFALSFTRHIVMIGVLLLRKACSMPSIVRESRGLAYFSTRSDRCQIPNIILPLDQQKKLSGLISTILIARTKGAALRNLLIHGPPGMYSMQTLQ